MSYKCLLLELALKKVSNHITQTTPNHIFLINSLNNPSQIPDMLTMHCETLEDVSTHAAKLPPVEKTTFLKARLELPPLVALERFTADPVHVYMLPVPSAGSCVEPQVSYPV